MSFSCDDEFWFLDSAMCFIINFCMKGHPVGSLHLYFHPLVVRVVVPYYNRYAYIRINGGVTVYIHIGFNAFALFLFFERRKSGFLAFYVGTFSVECRHYAINGG